MKGFSEWCEHYGYDQDSEAARVDYARYRERLEFFQALLPVRVQSDQLERVPETSRRP